MKDTMCGLVKEVNAPSGLVYHTDLPIPEINDDEVLIKVHCSAICGTDLHIMEWDEWSQKRIKAPVTVGHETAGEIVAVGKNVTERKVGDRVSCESHIPCGECYFCRHGWVNNCTDPNGGWALGCRIDGCQAEYVRVPIADNGMTPIPDDVSDEAALFNGDILATGYWAASIGEIKPADTVVVLGAGPTGLCTLMSIRLYSPAKVIVVDVSEERMALAKEQGLADICLNPTKVDVEAEVLRLTDGRGADRVFEVAGGENTFQLAWKVARPNAIVVLVALYAKEQALPLHLMYGKNLTFKTGGVDANCCEDIMKMIQCGKIDTSCLITHRAPLNDVMEGYRVFENKLDGCIKWVITPYERD